MALSVAERKERMPHGRQRRVAKRHGVVESYVSAVMAGEIFPKSKRTKLRLRRVQVACASEIGLPIEEVFTTEELSRAEQSQLARAS